MKFWLLSSIIVLSSVAVILNAFVQKQNFYAATLYISNSSACFLVLMNMGLLTTVFAGKMLQKLFFGQLRQIEVEHLYERSWFAITEICLAMTIFRDEFNSRFVMFLTSLLFLKTFHWLAQDRVDYMEQAASVPRSFHISIITVLNLLALADIAMVVHAVKSNLAKGPNMLLMFGFEYAVLFYSVLLTLGKYFLHFIYMNHDGPWENKSMYVFYLELVIDFLKLVSYLVFFAIIMTFYGLPLHIIRDLYLTLRSFLNKIRDLIRYRQATRNMDEQYPTVTQQDIDALADRTCIICREEMGLHLQREEAPAPAAGSQRNDTPKKLPCGHIFHFHCLRSWLERQQSCPTCRRSVLETNPPSAAPEPGNAPERPGQPPRQENEAPPPRYYNTFSGGNALNTERLNESLSSQPSSSFSHSAFHQGFAIPVTPFLNIRNEDFGAILECLSDDQLQKMEGDAREAIIQRLRAINRVQSQLFGITTQLTQLLQMIPESHISAASTSPSPLGQSQAGPSNS